jgi:WhiB family redox-sensing transcriptional regulator
MTLEATWPQRDAVDPAWAEHAACRGIHHVMFGVRAETRRGGTNWSQARALCDSCPVVTECLEHARANDEWDGMWGGLTPAERASTYCRRPGCRNGAAEGPAGYCSRNCQQYIARVEREKNGPHGKVDRARGGCRCDECSAVMDHIRARKAASEVARRGLIRAEVAS